MSAQRISSAHYSSRLKFVNLTEGRLELVDLAEGRLKFVDLAEGRLEFVDFAEELDNEVIDDALVGDVCHHSVHRCRPLHATAIVLLQA